MAFKGLFAEVVAMETHRSDGTVVLEPPVIVRHDYGQPEGGEDAARARAIAVELLKAAEVLERLLEAGA